MTYTHRGYSRGAELVGSAECLIPRTDQAVHRMDRLFGVKREARESGEASVVTIQGCVAEGQCELEGIEVNACAGGGGYPDCNGSMQPKDLEQCSMYGECGGSGPWTGTGGGGDAPPTEEESRNCPDVLVGKVITALIPVAGRNHEFRFEGPMRRGIRVQSPATYTVNETTSRDAWWIAQAGTVTVNCTGGYSPSAFGYKVWVGVASFAGRSDLHMVMGPGHPSF